MTLSDRGPWDLPVKGFRIARFVLSTRFDLTGRDRHALSNELKVIADGEGDATVELALPAKFELHEPDASTVWLDFEHQTPDELAAFLAVLGGQRISSLTVTETARVDLQLSSGRSLTVEPDGRAYEQWEITGPDYKLIALPGDGSDGVAIWDNS